MILNFASNNMKNDKKTTIDVLKAIFNSVDNLAVMTYAEDYGFRCPLYREVTIDDEGIHLKGLDRVTFSEEEWRELESEEKKDYTIKWENADADFEFVREDGCFLIRIGYIHRDEEVSVGGFWTELSIYVNVDMSETNRNNY